MIETPTWSNAIDREPPTAAVIAEGTAGDIAANVTWSGTDDTAGIDSWEIRVAKDGGRSTLWRTASEPGSGTYQPTEPGTYSFRAVARDGAGNVAQSGQSAVKLVGLDAAAPETTIASGPDASTERPDADVLVHRVRAGRDLRMQRGRRPV